MNHKDLVQAYRNRILFSRKHYYDNIYSKKSNMMEFEGDVVECLAVHLDNLTQIINRTFSKVVNHQNIEDYGSHKKRYLDMLTVTYPSIVGGVRSLYELEQLTDGLVDSLRKIIDKVWVGYETIGE